MSRRSRPSPSSRRYQRRHRCRVPEVSPPPLRCRHGFTDREPCFLCNVAGGSAGETAGERQAAALLYWALRAYHSGHREGWEPGPSVQETMDGLHDALCNLGYDPNLSPQAMRLMARKRAPR